MPSDSIIDQRRMMQARIDALFAGKISAETFLRIRKTDEERHVIADRTDSSGPSCPPSHEIFGA